MKISLWLPLSLALLALAGVVTAVEPATFDFNRDIRPILSENCLYCHGQDGNKREADLRLDNREAALQAGAIVPHEPEKSSLIERIFADDPETQMPPPKSNRRLSPEQKERLKQWIAAGAPYQEHWAYVAPQRPTPPEVKNEGWVRQPWDRFVLAKLEAEGITPSPEADRATLLKRLAIDLTGLPPTPEEVEAFQNDADPQAYEKQVERLLSSPHYGERMALPWLDAARYADSNGFQQDGDTWQWMWRDWVVKAYNDDLPFDQFTLWQLAGDLLPNATVEQKIASGFNRNHLLNGEGGAIAEEQRWVILFDRIDTTCTTWLGVTMACVQCHDHKYDPFTLRDYYSLLDAFNRVPESGTPQRLSQRIRVAAPHIQVPTAENQQRIGEWETKIAAAEKELQPLLNAAFLGWREGILREGRLLEGAGLPEPLTATLRKPEKERTDDEKKSLEPSLRKHFNEKVHPGLIGQFPAAKTRDDLRKQLSEYRNDQVPHVMIMSDERPRETFILSRGEYLTPTKEKVTFNTPAALPPLPANAPRNRLGLAQWLISPEHPLTARVQMNRLWQHFFGLGIVKTQEDLGVQSEYPVHGPLLDYLAVEFRERSWSWKQMVRQIVTSATYRQSSRVTPELLQRDAENRLYARASRFRMPSLLLRDWALAASGLLQKKMGGAGVYPYQPDGIWESLAITKERDFTYPASHGDDLYRRSLYTFWRRTVGPANMFDASNRQACRVRQSITSTPLHALTTLNDPTWVEASRVLAQRCLETENTLDRRLEQALRRVLCRAPTAADLEHLRRAYDKQLALFTTDADAAQKLLTVGESPRNTALPVAEHAALTVVCLGLFNLDEALTRE
jgi:hypothetical protein